MKHIEEVSLGALFLLEAAKKTDKAFCVTPSGGKHTVRGAENDLVKMINYLARNKAASHIDTRSSPTFNNPKEAGMDKLTNGTWLQDTINRTQTEGDEVSPEIDDDHIVDLDYEIADIF